MVERVRRLLGETLDGKPLWEPKPGHSILYSAAGGGKTTCGTMVWLLSLLADTNRALVIIDSKNAEIAAQCMDLCAAYGRKVAVVDDFAVLGADTPYRVNLSPYGSIAAAHRNGRRDRIFQTETSIHALIPEPANDAKNQFFRDGPRSLIEFIIELLLKRSPHLVTPGGVWSALSDPQSVVAMARVESEEGDETLAALSRYVLDLSEHSPEHWAQHLQAATKALRIYGASSPLHESGLGATITHADLLHEHYVVFLVGPIQHMARLGPHYALHIQSFLAALYDGIPGSVDFLLEEATNAPLKSLVSALTTMRGFGGSCHFVVQSRSELVRAFGEKETETIEENALTKQWFGVSSFAEARRLSEAIGEEHVLTTSLGFTPGRAELTSNLSTGKEPIYSRERLMRMGPWEQLLHRKGLGFVPGRKVQQNQLGPYCYDLADNPLEGARLPPEPRITLETVKRRRSWGRKS